MDLTIRFHRTQWENLPYEAQRLISQYVGPLFPDAQGVLTMVLSVERWAEIQEKCLSDEPITGSEKCS